MKIGYLLSGNPKTYVECVETFNTNLKDDINDVYSHLWWDESHQDKCYKMHFSEKLGNSDIANYLIEKFNIKKHLIESGKPFDVTFFKRFTKDTWGDQSDEFYKIMTPIVLYGLLSQTYSAYQSYILSSSNHYDLIIRSRPDLILTKKISSVIESLDIKDNMIFFQSSVNGGHLYAGEFPNKPCDWFFLGRQDAMGRFLKGWHDEIKESYTEGIMHTNELVKHVCNKNNLEIQIADFGAHIYKQATNYYDIYHNKIETYLEDFDLEKSRIRTPSIWPYWVSDVNFEHFKNIIF
jgi:hypothetical protein